MIDSIYTLIMDKNSKLTIIPRVSDVKFPGVFFGSSYKVIYRISSINI